MMKWKVIWELTDGITQDSVEYETFPEALDGLRFWAVELGETTIQWIQVERMQ